MPRSPSVDVKAILHAVYRRPEPLTDALAQRVRARLALLETASECFRLLVETPASAIKETLGSHGLRAESDVEDH